MHNVSIVLDCAPVSDGESLRWKLFWRPSTTFFLNITNFPDVNHLGTFLSILGSLNKFDKHPLRKEKSMGLDAVLCKRLWRNVVFSVFLMLL